MEVDLDDSAIGDNVFVLEYFEFGFFTIVWYSVYVLLLRCLYIQVG